MIVEIQSCACLECGHEWDDLPGVLAVQNTCPECGSDYYSQRGTGQTKQVRDPHADPREVDHADHSYD